MKMTSYTGMTLGGEVRESISLDEDDLSEVEDEVFIRDGKNGYKLAEEINMKRPLMAPRRKKGKITNPIKNKPPYKIFCRPCCYILTGLVIIIALIVVVTVLVSIYPLPLDKFRAWLTSAHPTQAAPTKIVENILPCSNVKIKNVWITHLPIVSSDSPVRVLDCNGDGYDDVVFGYGTGDNYNVLSASWFCRIFMGVPPPCGGGVMALDGRTGKVLWKYWDKDSVFLLQCNADVNLDGRDDCLAISEQGTVSVINSQDGAVIWTSPNIKYDIYVGNFIPDQNGDKVPDILVSHSSIESDSPKEGHLMFFSGKDGKILKKLSTNGKRTFFMPQLIALENSTDFLILYGTGSPGSPGTLNVAPLNYTYFTGNLSASAIYEDRTNGILTQAILSDITNDGIPDIIISMYNTTLIAFNGKTFEQIWNYTLSSAQSSIMPTPAYFNNDNITDFLIIYESYENILNYTYTQAFIIDGKTGQSIYPKPFSDTSKTQISGITLSMESHGFDMFLFWTSQCIEKTKKQSTYDGYTFEVCSKEMRKINKLNVLNQFTQPPGFEIYNSVNLTYLENNSTKPNVMYYLKKFLVDQVAEVPIVEGDGKDQENSFMDKLENRNDWQDSDIPPSFQVAPKSNKYNQNMVDNDEQQIERKFLPNEHTLSRNNRNKQHFNTKRNISSKTAPEGEGIYDYKNIRMAKNRLLSDLNELPVKILKDTYFQNKLSQLRNAKFQRDINAHQNGPKNSENLSTLYKAGENVVFKKSPTNLWDLETEKEKQDRENGYYRAKRNAEIEGIQTITTVGAVMDPLDNNTNSLDVIFMIYWQPIRESASNQAEKEITRCVRKKLIKSQKAEKDLTDEEMIELRARCEIEFDTIKKKFPNFNEIFNLNLGQITISRINVECVCDVSSAGEKCVKFLPAKNQSWPQYLGKNGDGVFIHRN